ncbi:Protein BUD31 like protein [Astathelohania contejeani]|uniref:Protein BUD31 like protein n=1 Tax=Astathelohania contejeani TaxID=164912 RepID=A0ABQ7HYM5_9MICR|nr:Protein BUD31 like protein [Thelohania contejeani]
MPRIPLSPPPGFEELRPFFSEIDRKLSEEVNSTREYKKSSHAYWNIFKLHRKRSRYVYDLYKSQAISPALFYYCTENKFCDSGLVNKWKKRGYENLCCVRCVQPIESRQGGMCICRVPKHKFKGESIECDNCGCNGCSGY